MNPSLDGDKHVLMLSINFSSLEAIKEPTIEKTLLFNNKMQISLLMFRLITTQLECT
jgi:hypothetical protein